LKAGLRLYLHGVVAQEQGTKQDEQQPPTAIIKDQVFDAALDDFL
jgi:hypothetical protein